MSDPISDILRRARDAFEAKLSLAYGLAPETAAEIARLRDRAVALLELQLLAEVTETDAVDYGSALLLHDLAVI